MFTHTGNPVRPDDLDDVPTERLEAEIQTLAGHMAAATCALLVMVGEYDRRGGHESWECLSTAHWLNWKCGTGMVAAREQVRVARRLAEMPVVLEAFGRGQLSYSKVRAISRVCHPGVEAELVSMAQHATAHQMERACSALRRCRDLDQEEARLRDGEAASRCRRSLNWSTEDNGDLVLRARIPAHAADTVLRALASVVDAPRASTGDHASQESDPEPISARRADALVELAANYLAHPHTGPGPQPEIVVHVHVPEATTPGGDSAESSGADAGSTAGSGTPTRGAGSIPGRWPVHTGRGAALSLQLLSQIACDAGLRSVGRFPDGSEVDLGRHRRVPDAALRRALVSRDVHCRFPGCHTRHRLHAHHIVWWALGGRTDRANLLMLCPKHHHAVHDRSWVLTGTAAEPHFSHPDGHLVDPAPPRLTGVVAELVDAHDHHGLDIAVDHVGGRWYGDRIDWDCFFAAMATRPDPGQLVAA